MNFLNLGVGLISYRALSFRLKTVNDLSNKLDEKGEKWMKKAEVRKIFK
ncbi:MAG TPA: hypothetical protein PLP57_09395 [Candidatus Saccharicenans sp.]|nr:hypothetical protein [Candidatus Saccharicenans sp.]HRD02835.1 hypothetical protein [Candidatus Saccharicenans sp.]